MFHSTDIGLFREWGNKQSIAPPFPDIISLYLPQGRYVSLFWLEFETFTVNKLWDDEPEYLVENMQQGLIGDIPFWVTTPNLQFFITEILLDVIKTIPDVQYVVLGQIVKENINLNEDLFNSEYVYQKVLPAKKKVIWVVHYDLKRAVYLLKSIISNGGIKSYVKGSI